MTHFSSCSTVQRQRGFTLVEAIVVMVIIGIIGGTMVLFIRQPVQNYIDAGARADIGDTADLALRRIMRELHGALPNSVRSTSSGSVALLEFIPAKAAGVYLSSEDNVAGGKILDFQNSAQKDFTVVSDMPVFPYNISANANPLLADSIVVYNLGAGFDRADAYAGGNRAAVSAVSGSIVTLNTNPFAVTGTNVPNTSPGQRFSVVTQPVTFACNTAGGTQTLTRYWNYGYYTNQPDLPTVIAAAGNNKAILASNVTACQFLYDVLVNGPKSLIGLTLTLGRPNSSETVTLSHQVHLDNTP